jgi:hypothetical protein
LNYVRPLPKVLTLLILGGVRTEHPKLLAAEADHGELLVDEVGDASGADPDFAPDLALDSIENP